MFFFAPITSAVRSGVEAKASELAGKEELPDVHRTGGLGVDVVLGHALAREHAEQRRK